VIFLLYNIFFLDTQLFYLGNCSKVFDCYLMAESVSSGSASRDGVHDIPDMRAVQRLLDEMDQDGQLGLSILDGEDSQGFSPPREYSLLDAVSAQGQVKTLQVLREAGERIRNSDDGELDVERERTQEERTPEAEDLQRGFVYPQPVAGSSDGERAYDDGAYDEHAEFLDHVQGTLHAEAVSGRGGSDLEEQVGAAVAQRAGLDAGTGRFATAQKGVLAGESSLRDVTDPDVDVSGFPSMAKFLEQRNGANGSADGESRAETVAEPLDLVGFIRAALEGNERAVFDRVVASFEAEAKAGDATAYDFLLLCGFTATISRTAPLRLAETFKGLDARLLREVGLLQTGISQATAAMEKVGSIPEDLVKVSALLSEMTERTEFHLTESKRLHAESLAKFNDSLKPVPELLSRKIEQSLAGLSETGQNLVSAIGKKGRPIRLLTGAFLVVVSLVSGFGLSTLMQAAMWQRLKVTAFAEADLRAAEEVEAFRKKVDAVQPERSILARLEENGLVLTAQPGTFADLYGTPRRAFILSLRSTGPQKLSKVERSELQGDLYFAEP
jgi:hypothetical protein